MSSASRSDPSRRSQSCVAPALLRRAARPAGQGAPCAAAARRWRPCWPRRRAARWQRHLAARATRQQLRRSAASRLCTPSSPQNARRISTGSPSRSCAATSWHVAAPPRGLRRCRCASRRAHAPPRRQVGMPGPITRLLACDEDRLQRCGSRCVWRAALPPRTESARLSRRVATSTWTWCPRTCTPTLTSCTGRTSATTTCRTTNPAASSTGARRAALRSPAASARQRDLGAQPSTALGRGRRRGGWREAGVREAARTCGSDARCLRRLENTNVTEDYVFFIDADMLFLRCVRTPRDGVTRRVR